jgi:hypothetical protein
MPGYIVPNYGVVWPQTRCQPEAVTVLFTCGYSADPDLVPKALIAAIKLKVADLYAIGRESAVVGNIISPTNALAPLYWPFKVEFAS